MGKVISADQRSNGLEILSRWCSELKVIRVEVSGLLLSAKIFWEVQKLLAANPRALSHRLFNDWMASNYFAATAIGIRRQLDKDPRSVSLRNLLMKIKVTLEDSQELISRSEFLGNCQPEERSDRNTRFSRLVGIQARRVDFAYVNQDIERLIEIDEKIIGKYISKRIAHRDAEEIERRKYGDLDKCLEVLEEITDRYLSLVNGEESAVSPELSSDWKSVFRIPWIPESD